MSIKNGAVILAAGEGKRMGASLPKVLCPVLGRPMLDYVLDTCKSCAEDLCVVVGFKADVVRAHLGATVQTVLQAQQLGTAHAVLQARSFIAAHAGGNILVVCGDAPLMDAKTVQGALAVHQRERNAITVITAELEDPASYGRIVKKDGQICAIVERKDADAQTLQIREINSGAYWFQADLLLELLEQIGNDNAQHEYYLTDAVKIAIENGLAVRSYVADCPDVVMGANDPHQLELLNQCARRHFCEAVD